ncbi:MAG: glycosyltransferase [Xanthomonadales bacterium]|nr:glycosyltransferase [Xanthomonadales bacterium]
MHVVQALVSLGIGGSEMVAVEITEYLRANGHRVTVVAANGPLKERIDDCGAEFLDWSIGRKRLGTLRFIRMLRSWILENSPDIVHVHSRLPAWVCYLAIRGLPADQRPVFITSMHGQYSVSGYSAIMARGDHVVAVSGHIRNYTLENYLPAYHPDLHTIYGGTSRRDFPYGHQPDDAWRAALYREFPRLENKRMLLLPGRLSRYKGHATFIEMLAALQPEFDDIHGVILGQARPGSRYINELEGLAQRNGISDCLTFCGVRTDMRDWMAASYMVFNLCSDPPEAFGRIATECLALGVPLVAWNHGGVREILQQMFPRGAVVPDNVAALVEKTREFLQDKPVVKHSDAFSLRDSMEQTLRLYQSALEQKDR